MQPHKDKSEPFNTNLDLYPDAGLRAVQVQYKSDDKFAWELFNGFDCMQVLTYSASVKTIVRMLQEFDFKQFECVFGYEGVIGHLRDMISFQSVLQDNLRFAIKNIDDSRKAEIFTAIINKRAKFWVLQQSIAHAKLYLLSSENGRKRIISGSANLSEQALSGHQIETLYVFEDQEAWDFHMRMFKAVRDNASDEIPLDKEQIEHTGPIELSDVPALKNPTILIETIEKPSHEEKILADVVQRIDKIAKTIPKSIQSTSPNGKGTVNSHKVKAELVRLKTVSRPEEQDSNYFSLDLNKKTAMLSGAPFPLEYDNASVAKDVKNLIQFWSSYQEAFEGDPPKLQRDYFTFASWLYFSPFMCDLRTRSYLDGKDVIPYPRFAVIFGKANCGKSSLIDLLMHSMFGRSRRIDKNRCTRTHMLALENAYKRLPIYFDDIARRRFHDHVTDLVMNEVPSNPEEEYPCFLFSMNADDPASYPDEVVKRVLMIHTTTSLPTYREDRRQAMQKRIQDIRDNISCNLYRRYISEVQEQLRHEPLPKDWLALSSHTLRKIIAEVIQDDPPAWSREQTWSSYAEHRYDRIKKFLSNVLRHEARLPKGADSHSSGWYLDYFDGKKSIIVQEQTNNFGRIPSIWKDVPSSLINEELSTEGRKILYRRQVEDFIGREVVTPGHLRKITRLLNGSKGSKENNSYNN